MSGVSTVTQPHHALFPRRFRNQPPVPKPDEVKSSYGPTTIRRRGGKKRKNRGRKARKTRRQPRRK